MLSANGLPSGRRLGISAVMPDNKKLHTSQAIARAHLGCLRIPVSSGVQGQVPAHLPLYMTYPQVAALPSIGNAVAKAYLPRIRLGQAFQPISKVISRH